MSVQKQVWVICKWYLYDHNSLETPLQGKASYSWAPGSLGDDPPLGTGH